MTFLNFQQFGSLMIIGTLLVANLHSSTLAAANSSEDVSKLQSVLEKTLIEFTQNSPLPYDSISVTFDPQTGKILHFSTDPLKNNTKKLLFPTQGNITQHYKKGHFGLDIASRDRPDIHAALDGKVIKIVSHCGEISYGCGGGYGNYVIIDHGEKFHTLYAHLSNMQVQTGDTVKQGEIIGRMGSSGDVYGKTGIFLYFEVHQNGVKVNPLNYLDLENKQ